MVQTKMASNEEIDDLLNDEGEEEPKSIANKK